MQDLAVFAVVIIWCAAGYGAFLLSRAHWERVFIEMGYHPQRVKEVNERWDAVEVFLCAVFVFLGVVGLLVTLVLNEVEKP